MATVRQSFSIKKILFPRVLSHIARSVLLVDSVWGVVVGLAIAFLLVVGWSGYFFYSRVVVEPEESVVIKKRLVITTKEVDEIVSILDERKQKFDETLTQ